MIEQSNEFNEYALEGRRAFLDLGTGNAKIVIYGGTRPAANGTPPSPPLGEIELDKPCGIVNAGQLVLTSSALPLATNTGVATWARWLNGNNDWAMDTDAGDDASDAEVKLDDTTIFAGGSLTLISAVLG